MKSIYLLTLLSFIAILAFRPKIVAQINLQPISGADGGFSIVTIDGIKVFQSNGTPNNYAPYIYLKTDEAIVNKTVYVELIFLDKGNGTIFIDYNSTTENYKNVSGRNSTLADNGGKRKMVFELTNAHFRNAQNLNADLRIYGPPGMQKHLIEANLFLEPTDLWKLYNENYLIPYSGRKYEGVESVDASTMFGKTIAGYQGWFRVPGDPSDQGWLHYCRDQNINDPTVEMWPDMTEYSEDEKYPVKGWKLMDGSPATLFSSANKRTVLRHFQWMQAYGIDGVAVQRFVAGLYPGYPKEYFRIPAYAREAANRTGRSFYIMYDQSGVSGKDIVDYIKRDWKTLVDSMKITKDERYQHHNGKPVVSIFGFWSNRFSAAIAHQILDIFEQPGYEAVVIGSGEAPEWGVRGWSEVYARMFAYTPWNVGNYTSPNLNTAFANTSQWADQKDKLERVGCNFMPLLFPGFGWDNLMNQSPGTTKFGRRKGEVLWKQVTDAHYVGSKFQYIAMFDEIDESTAIFKITNNTPVNHYFTGNENLPSDFYLCLTAYASKVFAKKIPLPPSKPDFARQSQPSIPDLLFPNHLDTISLHPVIRWSPAVHLSGIEGYEINIDGKITNVSDTFLLSELKEGTHKVSVRAKNKLGNYGGWSEVNAVYANEIISINKDLMQDYFNIYPNPCQEYIMIDPIEHSLGFNIYLYQMDGSKILEKNISTRSGQIIVQLPHSLANGVYVLSIGNKELSQNFKIIKN